MGWRLGAAKGSSIGFFCAFHYLAEISRKRIPGFDRNLAMKGSKQMKQETGKKSKKWIWLVALIALLVIAAGVVAAIFLLPKPDDQGEPAPIVSDLYWNLDRAIYTQDSETGLSTREPAEDGLYHIRFATKGQIVQYATSDIQLVNFIDSMYALGLVLDADGMIVDAIEAKEFKTEIAKEFFVKKIEGNYLTLNSSPAMNGMDVPVTLTDATYVSDVRLDAENPGQSIDLEIMDTVWAYGDADQNLTDLFISERPAESEVYMRLDRYYAKGETTRVPDKDGVYTIPFAVNGKVVELKCKDKAVVSLIDEGQDNHRHMGLTFDEEGYITGMMTAATALRGRLLADSWNVTAIDGNTVTITRRLPGSEKGKVATFNLTEDTFMCISENGCHNGFIGQKVDSISTLDRIICYVDGDNNALYIDVIRRMVENVEMYFLNSARYWNSATKEFYGEPAEDGYYYMDFYGNGKFATYKTKNRDLAAKVHSIDWKMMGLVLQGSVIKEVYHGDCVCGWGSGSMDMVVSEAMGSIVTISSGIGFDYSSKNWVLAPDVKIILATGDYSHDMKKETTLRPGDWVFSKQNPDGELSHIVIVARYEKDTKLYYNLNRLYNAEIGSTKRVPDADGYYVYDMLLKGKPVTVKTKDKKMADFIDKQVSPFIAMKVNSSGVVKEAYQSRSYYEFGKKVSNYNYVENLDLKAGTFDTYYYSNGAKIENHKQLKLAENCKVYNYSTNFDKYQGETTKLRNHDQIQGFAVAENNEVVEIYILEREIDSPIYWPYDRKYNGTTKETTRTPDKDGYYKIPLLVNGKIKTFKTKDKALASKVDAQTMGFAMETKGDLILKQMTFSYSRTYKDSPYGGFVVDKIKGQTVTLHNTSRDDNEWYKAGINGEVTLAKNCKVYDISPNAKTFGQATELRLGDYIKLYRGNDNLVYEMFVQHRNTRKDGHYAHCDHCDQKVYWLPYTGTIHPYDTHYYLEADFTTTGQKSIGYNPVPEGKKQYETVFDLNGNTLTSTAGRNFLVWSKLTIYDTAGGGALEASGMDNYSGGNILAPSGQIDIYGGTIRPTKDAYYSGTGSAIHAGASSVVNMYGGALEGGKANAAGGNLYLQDGAVFNMYDGKIVNGDCKAGGGNIHVGNGSVANLIGGTVSGGTARDGGNVYASGADAKVNLTGTKLTGGIAAASNATIVLDGKFTLDDVALQYGAKLDVTKMSKDSKITNLTADGIFTESEDKGAEYKDCFTVAEGYKPIDLKENELWTEQTIEEIIATNKALGTAVKTAADAMIPEIKNGNVVHDCPMCGATNVTWVKKTGGMGKVTSNVHVYYEGAVDFATYNIAQTLDPYTVCLLLADADITTTGRFHIGKGTLNIMGNGKITSNGKMDSEKEGGSKESDYGLFTINGESGGFLNLFGGEYVYTGASVGTNAAGVAGTKPNMALITTADTGIGVVSIYNDVKIGNETLDNTRDYYNVYMNGTLNMFGGTIRNGTTKKVEHSGNITVTANGTVNLYDGVITGGQDMIGQTEGTAGGNLRFNGGKFNMYGGTVSNGICANGGNGGGNINLYSTAVANIMGGTITNGRNKTGNGGNIFVQNPTCVLNVGGNAVISDGKAASGGNIYVKAGNATTIGGNALISGGESTGIGGSIGVNGSATVTICGNAVVTGGVSPTTGGNIGVNKNGALIIGENAKITKGTATLAGGNIGTPDGGTLNVNITINGGEVSYGTANGTAANQGGGNIFMYGTSDGRSTLTINGGTISHGTSAMRGGNIAVRNSVDVVVGAEAIIENGTCTSNNANATGGNFYVFNGCTLTTAGTIRNGLTQKDGGNIHSTTNNTAITVTGGKIYGGSAAQGGNFYINTGSTLNIQGGEIYGGISTSTQGDNIRAWSSKVIMSGGTITAGTKDSIWLVNAAMEMTGGTVIGAGALGKPTDLGYSSAVKVVSYNGGAASLHLAGDAKVVRTDGTIGEGEVSVTNGAKLTVAPGWSGKASVFLHKLTPAVGDTIPAARGYVGTPTAQNTSAEGTFTGTLEMFDAVNNVKLGKLVGVNGALVLEVAP